MASEHGGCCCNHDDEGHRPDQSIEVQAPQNSKVINAAGCCGGAAHDDEQSRSGEHALRSTEVGSS
ncbi:MAG: hypothetical protein ABI862_15645 [Ilumatobacteraceae bacterium]